MKQNYKFFDKWYIITHENDSKTIDVIKQHNYDNVEIMYFDFYKSNKPFNKGGAIMSAQNKLTDSQYTGDVLLIDSDIYLPDNFLELIKNMVIKDKILYGVGKRKDYYSYEHFINDKVDLDYTVKFGIPSHFNGYFQLYKHLSSLLYADSVNCGDCDTFFWKKFQGKEMIDDMEVKHLGRANSHWNGRKDTDDFIM
jgi:hypothetical protein